MKDDEISLREFLNLKFESLGKDVARLEGRYQEFERKNCSKHQEMIKQIAEYKGEMISKVSYLDNRCVSLEKVIEGDNVKSMLGLYNNAKNIGIKIIVLLGLLGLIYLSYLTQK